MVLYALEPYSYLRHKAGSPNRGSHMVFHLEGVSHINFSPRPVRHGSPNAFSRIFRTKRSPFLPTEYKSLRKVRLRFARPSGPSGTLQ